MINLIAIIPGITFLIAGLAMLVSGGVVRGVMSLEPGRWEPADVRTANAVALAGLGSLVVGLVAIGRIADFEYLP